jgi:5-carboxymethyl-2-hydroxymuconate isomerase
MSHMTLEYSGNLREQGRLGVLCRDLARFISELQVEGTLVFPIGGIRVRALPCDDFCIGDGSLADAAFVHAILKIGAGRTAVAKQAICAGLFDIMKRHFAAEFASHGLALSLELAEFSESGTLKHNNLHAWFQRK